MIVHVGLSSGHSAREFDDPMTKFRSDNSHAGVRLFYVVS